MPDTITMKQRRLAAIAAQGLGNGAAAKAGKARVQAVANAIERHGLVRTLGGMDVYLALRARVGGMTRKDADSATESGLVQVTPAVRGCIYLAARRQSGSCLRLAEALSAKRQETDQARAGIKKGEVEKLAKLIPPLLAKQGPMTTDQIRRALPEKAVRALGETGKKVGISSTLPPALRRAEFDGLIERTLEGGRMDTERYLWRVPTKSVFEEFDVPEAASELHPVFADLFLRTAGVSGVKAFAAWSGLNQTQSKAAFAALDLVELAAEGEKDPVFVLASMKDKLLGEKAQAAAGEAVAFLPFEDNLLSPHGGLQWMVDEAHHAIEVPVWGMPRMAPLNKAKHVMLRSIVAGGKASGFWEYDPDDGRVVTWLFDKAGPQVKARVAAEADALGSFIRDEVGHGRSFSLDTDEELRKRAGMLRKMK